GRPVLFIGPAEATPARIVERFACGWRIACGDVAGLVTLLTYLDGHRDQVHAAGRRARAALLAHYDLDLGVAHLCSILGAETLVPASSDLSLVTSDATP
ncbi:MAG TPA: hypothetical protein VGD62_13305, partial [Acidobacteriaceae bacterium]